MRFRFENLCLRTVVAVVVMGGALGGARLDRHEARVNTFVQGTQEHAVVAAYPDGGMVVAWDSRRQEAGTYGVYLQRYAANGSRIGGEIGVNDYRRNMQTSPSIAVDSMGGTWVAWESFGQDGSMGSIVARRFGAGFGGGTSETLVNEVRRGHQFGPVVAGDSRGGAMIAWSTPVADGSERRIVARMFDRTGEPASAEFAVSPEGVRVASVPSIASTAMTSCSLTAID